MTPLVKWLRRGTILGIFLIPFLPLYVSGSMFFPFITGKNFAFRIIVLITAGLWAALALYSREYRPKMSALMWSVIAFAGFLGLSTLFAENTAKSFWSNFERMEGYITVVHLLLYFFITTSVLTAENLWKRFITTSVVASGLLSIYGLFQIAGAFEVHQGGVRLDATFGNATYFAIYLVFHLFFIGWLILKNQKSWKRIAYGLLGIIEIVLLYYTATRGAILGLIGGLFLAGIIIAFGERDRLKLRRISIVAVILVTILSGVFIAVRKTSFVQENQVLSRFANISLTERTVTSRVTLWGMAIDAFKERPILGWGQDGFIYVFGKYYRPELWQQEPWFDRAHNVFLDWLVAGGVLGFLSYLSLYIVGIILLWRGRMSFTEKALLTGLFAGYAFHNITVFDNIASSILFFTLLGLIYASSYKEEGGELGQSSVVATTRTHIMVSGVLIVALAGVIFLHVPGIRSARSLIQALVSQEGGPAENLAYYKETIARGGLGVAEAREQLSSAAATAIRLDVSDEVKQDFVTTARAELDGAIKDDLLNPRYYIFAGALMNRIGDYATAQEYLENGLEISPVRQMLLFELGNSFRGQGDEAQALEAYRRAFDADPAYPLARAIYAAALIRTGDIVGGKDLIKERAVELLEESNDLVNALVAAGEHEEVLALWKSRATKFPEDAQTQLSLAAAYLQVGDKNSAISTIEKAIEIDPTFSAQGQEIIKQIRGGTIQF